MDGYKWIQKGWKVSRDLPKRPNKAPHLAHKSDKYPDTGCICPIAIHGVRDVDGRDDLISCGGNGCSYDGRHIPRLASFVQLDCEHDNPTDSQGVANITQPQTIFWRWVLALALLAPPHPPIRDQPSNLLPQDRSNNHAQELQADLLGVKAKQFGEDLRDFDGEDDTAPEEDHGIGTGGDHHAGLHHIAQWLDKIPEAQVGSIRRKVKRPGLMPVTGDDLSSSWRM